MARGHLVARSQDADENVIGRFHTNSILETRTYQVEFAGSKVRELTANVIAESMYSQCDAKRKEYLLLDALVDYHKDNKSISLSDQQITVRGRQVTCKATAGEQICCQWNDGSTSWEKLSQLKECHLVQTAEFAVTQGIDHEPAFNWWVQHVFKKKDIIIASVRKQQTRYLKRSQKVGIDFPKTVEEALILNAKNGNTLWADAISEEMENVRVAFEVLSDGKSVPIGHQFV